MNFLIKSTVSLFTLCLFVSNLQAQFKESHPVTGKWALVEDDGLLLTGYEFDKIERRSDTLFVVHKDGLKGLVDGTGKIKVPIEWPELETWLNPFGWQNGFAAVTRDPKQKSGWGMVNSRGEIILPLKYKYVRCVFPDLLVGQEFGDTIFQFFNAKGEALFKTPGRRLRKGFDDKTMKIERPDRSKYFAYADGKKVFPDYIENPNWTDGKYVIAFQDRKAGIVNWQGETLVPFVYNRIEPRENGEFYVSKNYQEYGLIDGSGKFIIPLSPCPLERRGRRPGDAFIAECDNESNPFKIYDAKGNLLESALSYVSSLYQDRSLPPHPDSHYGRYFLAQAEGSRLYYFYSVKGNLVLPEAYTSVIYYSDVHPILVKLPNENPMEATSTAFDFNGNRLLTADKYYNLKYTTNPRLLFGSVEQGKRHGFIHLDNPDAADMKYKHIRRNYRGFLIAELANPVSRGQRFAIFDPAGRSLTDQLFDQISDADKNQVKRFQKNPRTRGRLIATARHKDTPYGDWIGLNEQGEEFYFSKEKKVEVPVVKKEELPMEETAPVLEELPMEQPPAADVVHRDVDQRPSFPGGEKARLKFISENIQYPPIENENGIKGTVVVEFVVEKDGSLNAPKIKKDICRRCGAEVLRLIRTMPKWVPAKKSNQVVRAWHTMEVKFELE